MNEEVFLLFQSVTGVWALNVDDAQCVALNHKYKLIAFGRKCSEVLNYFSAVVE